LSRRRRLFGSIDYQPSAEMYFVTIRSLGRAERIFWYRMSRSMTVAAWREEKRRTVACTDAVSYS